jgi:hypothetical protein
MITIFPNYVARVQCILAIGLDICAHFGFVKVFFLYFSMSTVDIFEARYLQIGFSVRFSNYSFVTVRHDGGTTASVEIASLAARNVN